MYQFLEKRLNRLKYGTLNLTVKNDQLDLQRILAADPVMGWRLFFTDRSGAGISIMEVAIHIGNLSKSTTQEDLNALFSQAGDVKSVDVAKDRHSGESYGFAYITMSAQSEADKAVSMFNAYPLNERYLRVTLVRRRTQRGFGKS